MKKSLLALTVLAAASAMASTRQVQDYIHFGSNSIDKDDIGAGGDTASSGTGKAGSIPRGFATMDRERQREIASLGGRTAHERGSAHEFTSEEGRAANRRRYELKQGAGDDVASQIGTMSAMTSAADKGVASFHGGGSGGITHGPAAMKAGNSLSPHPASLAYGVAQGSIPATA